MILLNINKQQCCGVFKKFIERENLQKEVAYKLYLLSYVFLYVCENLIYIGDENIEEDKL